LLFCEEIERRKREAKEEERYMCRNNDPVLQSHEPKPPINE
jgi:hypothetical protein